MRYPRVPMDEAFINQAVDFLMYVAYRGTEYYKIFNLREAFSEQSIVEKEAAQLQFIGVDGFKALINKAKYWELLDAVIKSAYPNAELPERKLSDHEQKLVEKHEEELSTKNQEILNLKGVIRRKDEEILQQKEEVESQNRNLAETKEELSSKLEEELKKVEGANLALEEERKRLKTFTSKLVALEGELKKKEEEKASLVQRHKEEMEKAKTAYEKEIEKKASEIKSLQSELTRAKLAKTAVENDKAILQDKHDENLSGLESRRREALAFTMKRVQLDMATMEMEDRAANLTRRVQSIATSHAALNAREAEIEAAHNFSDIFVQEKLKELRAEAEAELTDRFTAVEVKEVNIESRETAIIDEKSSVLSY